MREPGTEIHGRFRLVRLLGTGLGGETWLAEDRAGAKLALKLLSGESSQARSDLLREAHVLQGIVHENVVRYRGIVDMPGDDTCLFMDYIAGGDLQDLVRKRYPDGFGVRAAAALLLQVLEALDTLHEAGVLHRDLKPKNILVGDVAADLPHLLVADFGIAKHTTRGQSGETRPVGTPGYMAPEQYTSRTLTNAVDFHALGGIGWFLSTGTSPPEAGDLTAFSARRDATRGREHAWWALLCRLRHPDPSSRGRLSDARKVLEAVAASAEWTDDPHEDPSVTVDFGLYSTTEAPEQTIEPDPPPARRADVRTGVLGALLGVGAMTAVVAAIALWPTTDPPKPPIVEDPPTQPEVDTEVEVDVEVEDSPPTAEEPVVPKPPAAPTGTLTVFVDGTSARGVRVLVDGKAVPGCDDCPNPAMALYRHPLPPGRHMVLCEGPAGRDVDPQVKMVEEGVHAEHWCAPVY